MGGRTVLPAVTALGLLLFAGCSGSAPDLRTGVPQDNAAAQAGRAGEVNPADAARAGAAAPANPGRAAEAIGGYPYKGKPLYVVGERPVTEEELRRYKVRMVPGGMQGHGESGMDNLVRSFAYYWATVELGIREGVPASKQVRDVLEAYRCMALANDYRAHLEKATALTPEEARGFEREKWTRIRFLMRTYPSEEEAQKEYRALLDKKKALSAAEFDKEVREEFRSDSGPIFRDSGFFTPFDDHYLFDLRQGEVSRPVETGVGIALCFVAAREDLDAAGVKEYVAGEVAKRIQARVAEKIDAIGAAAKFTVLRENFRKAVHAEGRTGAVLRDPVLVLPRVGGDITIRYNDFRNLITANYAVFFKEYPSESWVGIVEPNLRSLAMTYAIGREAERQGIRPSARWDMELFDFKVKTVYLATLEQLGSKTKVRVDDAEVRRFYDRNRGLFSHDVILKVFSYYSPEKGGLQALEKQAGSREDLFRKKEFERLRRPMLLTRESRPHAELYGKVKDLKAGAVSGIVKADMGYYIVKVEDRREKGFTPLAEARDEIREYLEGQARDERVNDVIASQAAGMSIRKL